MTNYKYIYKKYIENKKSKKMKTEEQLGIYVKFARMG